jgi:hypothetical protein
MKPNDTQTETETETPQTMEMVRATKNYNMKFYPNNGTAPDAIHKLMKYHKDRGSGYALSIYQEWVLG